MHNKSPSKIWRKKQNKYRLTGSKSHETGKTYYPPRHFEADSMNRKFDPDNIPEKATLITWSIVRVAPKGFDAQTPYVIAILELENGERLTGQIVDIEDFNILNKGDTLYSTFRKMYQDGEDGVIHYGLKWRL
jgi:hypothetical protein